MDRETSIEYVKGDKHATFYSGEPKYINMIQEIVDEFVKEKIKLV